MSKKEKMFVGFIILLFSLILIAFGINETFLINKSEIDKCFITLSDFNQIATGMTYEETKNIVGCKGTIISEIEILDSHTIIYYWYGKNGVSNANFTFQNNELLNKTQIGLK